MSEDIFDGIYEFTDGVPRRINTLMDRLLLNGYLEEIHEINRENLSSVANEIIEEQGGLADSIVLPPLAPSRQPESEEPVDVQPVATPRLTSKPPPLAKSPQLEMEEPVDVQPVATPRLTSKTPPLEPSLHLELEPVEEQPVSTPRPASKPRPLEPSPRREPKPMDEQPVSTPRPASRPPSEADGRLAAVEQSMTDLTSSVREELALLRKVLLNKDDPDDNQG